VDLDIHHAPSINQHVAATGGTATDDLALIERRVRGVIRLLQALFLVRQDLDLLAAHKMTLSLTATGYALHVEDIDIQTNPSATGEPESGSQGLNRSTHWARQVGGSQGSPK
jgi:hypothetical protein